MSVDQTQKLQDIQAGSDSPGDQVLSIIADVEKQLERMRSAQSSHAGEIVSLAERAKALENAEKEIAEAKQSVLEREQALKDYVTSFDVRVQEVHHLGEQNAAEKRELEAVKRELERGREQFEQDQKLLQQDQDRAEGLRKEIKEQLAEVELQRGKLGEAEAQIAEQRRAAEAIRAELAAKVTAENEELSRIRGECQTLTSRVEKAESNVGELIARIESMQDEQERSRKALEEAGAKIEKAEAAGFELLEQAESQRLELTAKLTSVEEAAVHNQSRLDAVTAELASVRAQLSQRETTVAETNEKLRLAGAKLAQFSEAIEAQSQAVERGAAAMAECIELRRTIERLEQSSKTDQQGAADSGSELQSELTGLRVALAAKEASVEALKSQMEEFEKKSRDEANELNRRHESRCAELQARLEQAESEKNQSKVSGPARDQLEQKAKLIQEVATHLRRRKGRLEKIRRLVKERRQGASAATTDQQSRTRQLRDLQEKKDSLLEVQRCLAASEQQMMRRWARPRAMATIGWLIILAAAVGTGSWFGAGLWHPAVISASVVVEAKAKAGQTPSETQFNEWQSAHEGLIRDELFVAAVSKRLEERQIKGFSEVAKLSLFMKENLTVDSDRPGLLRMTLKASDPILAMSMLDTVATTLTSESAKTAGRRSDGMKAVVAGEKAAAGRVEYASINATPVKDERLIYAGILFATGLAVTGLLWVGAYRMMLRSKRVFDSDLGLVDDGTTISLG